MMRTFFSCIPAMAGLLLLTGCGAPVGLMTDEAVGIYATKPSESPPADTADQMAQHESWCYRTMTEQVECFSEPQETEPNRLVNVDPPNRYPLTRKAYNEDVMHSQLAQAPKPARHADPSMETLPVQSTAMAPLPLAAPKAAPAPKDAVTDKAKAKKHKKKKKVKKARKAAPPAKPPATAPNPPPIEP